MIGPILAVDDDPDVRELLSLALVDVAGIDATVVADRDDALAALVRQLPSVLLMDVQLGTEDGVTLGEELRRRCRERSAEAPALLLLSGHVDAALRARARAAGAREVLAKPFDPLTLGETLASCLAAGSASSPTED